MKKMLFYAIAIGLFACNQPGNNKQTTENNELADTNTHNFFPVANYIAGQIKVIDSLQLPISKKITVGKSESIMAADIKDLIEQANQFQNPDFTQPGIRERYKETSFADQSIPSVTFNYTTTDTAAAFQRVDVIISPDPVKADKVRSIYMEKYFFLADTSIQQKLFWKADKHLLVITEKKIAGQILPVQQLKLTWDPTE
ncbi:MAG: hypothetical protein EAZ16_08450 [Sphingobacteriales bacterium]|nr:MAG: hypothetical protein EAZ16_08450 [Sphingobacteriales bacterium]